MKLDKSVEIVAGNIVQVINAQWNGRFVSVVIRGGGGLILNNSLAEQLKEHTLAEVIF